MHPQIRSLFNIVILPLRSQTNWSTKSHYLLIPGITDALFSCNMSSTCHTCFRNFYWRQSRSAARRRGTRPSPAQQRGQANPTQRRRRRRRAAAAAAAAATLRPVGGAPPAARGGGGRAAVPAALPRRGQRARPAPQRAQRPPLGGRQQPGHPHARPAVVGGE